MILWNWLLHPLLCVSGDEAHCFCAPSTKGKNCSHLLGMIYSIAVAHGHLQSLLGALSFNPLNMEAPHLPLCGAFA